MTRPYAVGLLLAVAMFILCVPPADARQSTGDDGASASCAVGKLTKRSKIGKYGVVAHYTFSRREAPEDIAKLVSAVNSAGEWFTIYSIQMLGTTLRLDRNLPLSTWADVERHFLKACAVMQPLGFQLDGVWLRSPAEERRWNRGQVLSRRKLQRRFGGVDLPTNKEVDDLLRTSWADGLETNFFGGGGTRFHQVRDMICQFTETDFEGEEDHYTCVVGVLATSARGPEYEQGELKLIRGPNYDWRRSSVSEYVPAIIIDETPGPHGRSRRR